MPELANDDQPPKACLTGIEQSAATKDGSHVRSASLYSKAVEVSGGKSRDRGSTSRTTSKADLADVPIEIKVRGRTIFFFFVWNFGWMSRWSPSYWEVSANVQRWPFVRLTEKEL
jgi:hypothetical protein